MAPARLSTTGLPATQTGPSNRAATNKPADHETGDKPGDCSSDPACHPAGDPARHSTGKPAIDDTEYAAFYQTNQQTGPCRPTTKYEPAGTQANAESGAEAVLSG